MYANQKNMLRLNRCMSLVFLVGLLYLWEVCLAANNASVVIKRSSFPKGFVFGTASSAYQVCFCILAFLYIFSSAFSTHIVLRLDSNSTWFRILFKAFFVLQSLIDSAETERFTIFHWRLYQKLKGLIVPELMWIFKKK